jgi:hypothetical protein
VECFGLSSLRGISDDVGAANGRAPWRLLMGVGCHYPLADRRLFTELSQQPRNIRRAPSLRPARGGLPSPLASVTSRPGAEIAYPNTSPRSRTQDQAAVVGPRPLSPKDGGGRCPPHEPQPSAADVEYVKS